MRYKKAELHPIALMIIVIVIGLIAFFGIRALTHKTEVPVYNVTPLPNETTTSTATKFVNKAGAVNITDGTDLTLKDSIVNITINETNQTLIKVIYPNHTLTPGAIMSTNVTQICTSGYSASVRDVSQSTKDAVYVEYKLSPSQPTGTFEVDHLVPLELGGSNDITNLWPQPRDPRPGYKEKDALENYYHILVCKGDMKLADAQAMMANNWFKGYLDARTVGGIK